MRIEIQTASEGVWITIIGRPYSALPIAVSPQLQARQVMQEMAVLLEDLPAGYRGIVTRCLRKHIGQRARHCSRCH